jgi:signal transduction histidine kinase/putative methionine-R-sulfoxide reductase with GAF domain
MILNDYYSSPRRSPQFDEEPYRGLFHALVGAPMVWQGEVTGALTIAHKTPGKTFSVHDAELLESFAARAATAIGNAELFERTDRQAKEMSALFEVSQALSAAQDSDSILNLVAKHTKTLIDYEGCAIYSLDVIPRKLRPVLVVGDYAAQVQEHRIEIGQGIVGAVARTGISEIVNQAHEDPRSIHIPDTPEEPQAILCVPLVVRGQVEGVVSLDRYGGGSFEENEKRLLTTIVNQAAAAIENLELLDRLRDKAEQLSAISEIATRIQNTDAPDKMWHLALTGATADKGLGFSRAMLFLVDESEKTLRGEFGIGATSQDEALRAWEDARGFALRDYLDAAEQRLIDAEKPLNKLVKEITLPISPTSGAPATCILRNEAIHVSDAHSDPRSNPLLVDRLGVDAFAAVPLIARKRAIGVLVVDNKFLVKGIQPGDVEILETFANQVAVAVENAHLVRRQEDLFGDIAHQLFSPITSLRGYASLLADGKVRDAETLQEYYEIITEAVEYLGGMAANLLNLRKIEAGIFSLQPEKVTVTQLVQEAVNLYRYAAESKDIDVQTVLRHRAKNEWIEADKEKMITAIQNLVENAIKYSPEESTIVVATSDDENSIRIAVQDRGPGIPADELQRVFGKHFRGRIAEERRIDGTGSGLTIAQYVAEQHGGGIRVESELGEGSTFTIVLPL